MSLNKVRLLNQVFGTTRLDTSRTPSEQSLSNIKTLESDATNGLTLLGTPLFMPVRLDGNWLPNEPLIEITGANVLIRTQMDNGKGTFKELFARDDFQIIIRGFCVSDKDDKYPETQVKRIIELCNKGVANKQSASISIENRLCNMLKIFRIVIEKYSLPSLEGYQNTQPYELTCYSDSDFQIELDK
jgi:hypothetical protein